MTNKGVLKRLTEEYFGDTERREDMIELPEGVIRVDFTDRNGRRHRNGYRVVDGSKGTLQELIEKLIHKRGSECDLNDVDVSNVTNMGYMFAWSLFNGDISGWDVSKVENMAGMFYNSAFNGDISGWDVSGVRDMSFMFVGSDFNGDISGWDVSGVTDIRSMFYNSPLMNNPPEWYKEE